MFEAFVHAIFWPFFLGSLLGMMSISNPLSKIPLSKAMGRDALKAITRIMGFLLVCIGVQFVGSGVRTFIAGQ